MKPANYNKVSDAVRYEIEDLYLKHRDMIFNAAFRTIRNRADAEDALQNVFVGLLEIAAQDPKHLDCFRENPEAYLYQAAVYEALDMKKMHSRRRLVDEEIDDIEISTPGVDSVDVLEIGALRRALTKLKPEQAELLSLHYVEGRTRNEIAKMTGKGMWAVFKEISRATKEVKKAILNQERQNETQKVHEGTDFTSTAESFEA